VVNKKKNFLDKCEELFKELLDKQVIVEDNIMSRILEGYKKLNDLNKVEEIEQNYSKFSKELKDKLRVKFFALEEEYKDGKSVTYFLKKVDLETANFKKTTHLLEKKEEQVHEELKKSSFYGVAEKKQEYEKERLEWKEEHKENVRICRQEKQNVKKDIEANLEKPSEIAQSLVEESGPDYTGGDD
jgi:hypothetical protein